MQLPVEAVLNALWILFVAYWVWSARRVKGASRTEPAWSRLLKYWLPLVVAALLLEPGRLYEGSVLGARFLPAAGWVAPPGVVMTLAGLLFACWARHVLGSNWSAVVQLKQNHELIERGPYRHVRHPIYTGLLLAFLGTAVALGEWRGLLALAIVAVSFWRKLRLEERWLGEQFGVAYADYMRRVKALIPGVL
ncbi:isoprenylcysteine carboxyl methyltransferase [Rhodanobacter sp. Soil772]|uniref:methyltransferase family protein n=1 Tax=Rhodanobacter sp. Soil772 TaxID=1736406 RepID=UPI0006FB3D98|nr:isoprenylcysteine carboxylmethyltransferase family protein [Rhodanobacter sp. Soil772]KRE85761.1 isoprenylcysteine carboxyl methyltransferase [Rhodanobacter sp. Soil772]